MGKALTFDELLGDDPTLNAPEVGSKTMSSFTNLCEELIACQDDLAKAKASLAEAEEAERLIREERLPGVMEEMQLSEFKFKDGTVVKLTTTYAGSIKADNKNEAHEWLRTHGHGSLIKNEVKVSFGKGEDVLAGHAEAILKDNGFGPVRTESVHYQTLRGFVKEQIEAGRELPETISVHITKAAKLKKG